MRPPALAVLLALLLACAVPAPAAAADPDGVWPLQPRPAVATGFDPPASPWGAGHRGVDLVGGPGQVVRAALPGTVSYAAGLAGRGVVVVSHGTTRTTYEPVQAEVSVGDPVGAGDRLGTLQTAPSHCVPRSCLHWGWIDSASGDYLDPLRLVGVGPVRLLPFLSGAAPARVPAARLPARPVGFALDPRLGVL
ncbi:M23 family metallopeptidase [uncultured Nocardioides sp.]|uniref:M23 family metallopeptidase n=1 Tax=uncultured Nocardioides sp. TaxID=198441 RepID=UPI00261665E0|nr:M23 family metallopeptidase [uncultured Nocardioides sp.]